VRVFSGRRSGQFFRTGGIGARVHRVAHAVMGRTRRTAVFLSSTFLDLSEIRAEVSRWLSGVFGMDLIIMETSGSDAAPPDVNSVRRVRECDLFVGIYAHRYGTVDPATGKSITELEMDEAKRALSSGTISDILLYLVDKGAPWPEEWRETGPVARSGLARIREKAQQHTYTSFRGANDLLFSVVRDVYTRLSAYLGASPLQVRPWALPAPGRLRRPVGMEFLTSKDRHYLVGRDKEIDQLLGRLDDDQLVLLLGESGVGKTSLIHAGLLPTAAEKGWRVVYTRPYAFPCADIVHQIQATLFEGRPTYRGPLVPLLAEAAAALAEERILLIIDQFEDVLGAHDQREVDQLISALSGLRELAAPSLLALICYRSDLEARLGEYWQRISGSPFGLSRMYLGGLSEEKAWEGITRTAKDLSVNIKLRPSERARISRDLLVTSQAAGFPDVYPPYVQMLVDHMWASSQKMAGSYQLKEYQEAGGMEGIVDGYLTRQLEFAKGSEGNVKAVLVSLVRSHGVKAQRPLGEIVVDTGLDEAQCEAALEKLIDLRLVRHVEAHYEVSHDFIARRIISELVDSEEREFKRFRELLASKAAAYQTTEGLLTSEELLMLFKHKERIVASDLEMKLLLLSWLEGNGPGLYWLLNADRAQILDWLRAQESKPDLSREQKVSIVLLRRKLGEAPLLDDDYSAFRSYQLSDETAALILESPASLPREMLLRGLGHRRDEVREACMKAVALRVKLGEWWWIEQLRTSSSVRYRRAYEELILNDDVPAPGEDMEGTRATQEFALLKKIASTTDSSEARAALGVLQKKRPPARSLLFGEALVRIREGRMDGLLRQAQYGSKKKAEVLLGAIGASVTSADFDTMMSRYEQWNLGDRGGEQTPAIHAKTNALALACSRCMAPQHLSRLRAAFQNVGLALSSRPLVLALLNYGDSGDLKLVLDRVAAEAERVDFWNHTELGRAAARRLQTIADRVPDYLLVIESRREFWEYAPSEDRAAWRAKDLLPIKSVDNRALYIRLAAYGMIGSVGGGEQDLLVRLTGHDYGLIARDAAIRLVRLNGETALRLLAAKVDDSIRRGESASLANALRSAEIELFGVASLW